MSMARIAPLQINDVLAPICLNKSTSASLTFSRDSLLKCVISISHMAATSWNPSFRRTPESRAFSSTPQAEDRPPGVNRIDGSAHPRSPWACRRVERACRERRNAVFYPRLAMRMRGLLCPTPAGPLLRRISASPHWGCRSVPAADWREPECPGQLPASGEL